MARFINATTFALLLAAGLLLSACGDADAGADTGADADTDTGGTDAATTAGGDTASGPVTWHQHVRPVVAQRCLACHDEGGAAPFTLTDWDTVEARRFAIVTAVRDRVMPPWTMDTSCRDVKETRALSEAEIKVFTDWRDDDFLQGDPATYVAPATHDVLGDLGPAGIILDRDNPYRPDPKRPDDYRCFVYPQTVGQDMWVTATNVLPDKTSIVHHVLIYVIPPGSAADVVAQDTGDGYQCYGGPGSNSAELISGWVPGMQPQLLPDGAAFEIKAGSRFVVQMHYNTLGFKEGAEIPADATDGQLWLMPRDQQPTHKVRILPVADTHMNIEAGDRNSVQTSTMTWPVPVTIIGTVPHMHLLGTRIALELERPNGEVECLTDIPAWDFNWQQMYFYEDADQVAVDSSDKIHLTCEYDNSQENQPVVNGEQQTPRDVQWGDGTLDEMCLNYLLMMQPIYTDGKDTVCDGFEACVGACEAGDERCPLACMGYAGNSCMSCGVQPLFIDCGTDVCPGPLLLLGSCLDGCEDGQLECAMGECREQFTGLWDCLEAPLRAGECDGHLSECGIVMTP